MPRNAPANAVARPSRGAGPPILVAGRRLRRAGVRGSNGAGKRGKMSSQVSPTTPRKQNRFARLRLDGKGQSSPKMPKKGRRGQFAEFCRRLRAMAWTRSRRGPRGLQNAVIGSKNGCSAAENHREHRAKNRLPGKHEHAKKTQVQGLTVTKTAAPLFLRKEPDLAAERSNATGLIPIFC
jgi:hypothetical protein